MHNVEENEKARGEFYFSINSQENNNIVDLVNSGHCVVFVYGKWKVVYDIIYN